VFRAIRLMHPAGISALRVCRSGSTEPGHGQIAVRIRASSLNYHDYAVVTGAIPTECGRIPLSDAAGEVSAVGEGVEDVRVGDRVMSTFFPKWLDGEATRVAKLGIPGDHVDGFAADEVTSDAAAFTPIPKGYDFTEAATLPCAGLTAWRAIVINGRVRPGETVLIQGTGGVSLFALQFAKACGATVIATSSTAEKLERLKELGADHVINYRETQEWGDAARRLTGGVDHVIEVGGAATLDQSVSSVRDGGHIALIGVLAGLSGGVSTARLMAKQVRLIGVTVGSRKHQLDMIRGIEAIRIRPHIDRLFPLGQLAAAFRYQESGKHIGKIVLSM
jgi:NADPH:quinone reductase-like Zn-dependent oxidoreductase